ncbi:laminin subunit alpha-like [Acanthaster planci]|uniref:Laminin subunit alpha-like n=1 Tax=Acanthaster planci TaxID=133434 RepID=A0A8B7YTM1_ACAPL|nr:laminin subunit alpha-like [Acanthaster planci]
MEKIDVFWKIVVVCSCVLQQVNQVNSQASPVNVALNKPISANITCGFDGPENFYGHTEIAKPPNERVISSCNANNPALAHGPENMVDLDPATGDVYTWWQSTSRNRLLQEGMLSPDSQITINLQENYQIESIQIQMGDSVRPKQMAIFKSTDGIAFIPWHYKVTSSSECTSQFELSVTSTVSQTSSVLCTVYSGSAQPRNEVITFDFNPPPNLIEWQRARYVRFNFYNMEQSFGLFSNDYHHYTVRNINVLARCECNGHASDCTLQPLAGDPGRMTYQCECGGNTGGSTCSECLPFYNQLAYQTGESGFTCQECNCFGHSDTCIYDPAVGRVNGSLDSSGNYSGGGVCQDCRNFTAGINCQQCQRFYYRPSGKLQTDEDACQPCSCNIPGTREDPSTGLVKGECVMNSGSPSPSGMLPGDCYCKVNVQGSKCEECKDGFYDLTDANSNGCLSCNCFTAGTVSASNICSKDATGQCPCKNFTIGRRCNQCMDGYYGLAADNPEGCSACSCDAGGALSATCDKVSGVCACRSNIEGRQCNSLTAFSYYPTLHSISAEFESIDHTYWERDSVTYPGFSWYGYVTLTGQMSTTTTLTVPPSQLRGTFEILLRVANQGTTQVDLTISKRGATDGAKQRGTVSLPLCPSWCLDGVAQNVDVSQGSRFTLGAGEWDITITVNLQGGARVLFDQVVALPIEFSEPSSLLGEMASDFTTVCDVYNNNMRIGTSQEMFCLANVFTLTTFYFDGAMPCNCNPTGSVTLQCESYGGQCECKPGVGGQMCDMCLPEFYAFRSTGCTPCNCFGDDKVCDMTTGQCGCSPNTAGQRCDRCVTFAWGLDSTNGCQLCNCDPLGSVNPQCDLTTGLCTCKLGVGGMRCNQCLDGFQGLTFSGCTTCQCDLAGSLGTTCNKTTGQCPCKELTEGLTCGSCTPGSFFNSPLHQTGCLQCICMGITAVCDSTQDTINQYNLPTDASLLSNWSLVSDLTTLAPFPGAPMAAPFNNTDFIAVTVQGSQDAFWMLPSLTGNLLGVYGSPLQFSVRYTAQGPPGAAVAKEAKIYMKGPLNTYTRSLGMVPLSSLQAFSIQITETEFIIEGSGASVDRSDFLRTLSSVEGIFVSASLTVVTHQSSIGEVSYSTATDRNSPLYNPLAARALSVEQCSCGIGYSGYSCEDCATGYRRSNVSSHPFFGECVACNCNGHSGSCDPETGQCLECSHNTTGFNCEQCADGFYGDATKGTPNDCTECPCGLPQAQSAACSVINGTVTCLQCNPGHLGPLCDRCDVFHYGEPHLPNGFCTPCFCNGNTDQCNTVTGQCLSCGSRTTGFNCERCLDFTFGNASVRNCQDCNCDPVGSSGNLCDHSTGQCPCRPGVGDRRCNVCLPNFYNFSSQGCQACDCNEFGSVSLQCGQDGLCPCRANVDGIKCDQCMVGRYGLPQQLCADCDCDVRGSEGGALAVCDIYSGQCPCKPGVGSRRCDQCLPTYVNFTDTGCSKCDQCVDTLQNSTVSLNILWMLLWEHASLLNELQQRDAELEGLRPQVVQRVTQLNDTLTSFAELRRQVQNIDEQGIVSKVDGLVTLVGQAMEASQTLLNNATSELQRVQGLSAQAESVLAGVSHTNQTGLDYLDLLENWNATAALLPGMAQGKLDRLVLVSFETEERMIRAELARSQNVSRDAEALLTLIMSQSSTSNALNTLVVSAETQFMDTMQIVTNTHTLLNDVEDALSQVGSVVTQIETQLNYSSQLLSESQDLLQRIDTMLTASRTDISDGDQAFADANTIRQGAAAGSPGVPVDPSINQEGQNGWINTHSSARNADAAVSSLQPVIESNVLSAENHVLSLTSVAQESSRLFAGASALSQQAVDVVQRYQAAVSSITEAELMSEAANASISTTQQSVEVRTLAALQEDASTSRERSVALENEINARNTDVAGLERSLLTANETLVSAEDLWDTIAVSYLTLQEEANALSQTANDPQIQPIIDQGLSSANLALGVSGVTLNNTRILDNVLTDSENDIEAIRETVNNVSSLLGTTPGTVSEVEADLVTLSQKTVNLTALQNETSQMRSAINERLARLREKLRRVQDRIATTKQPARFSGQTSLEIQLDSGRSTLSNEVQLDFKADSPDGLVFFMESTANQFYSVEVVAGKAQFSFNINRDAVTIQSPIEVCCGEWYQAIGTRYANEGHLSIVKLSTGGASATYGRSTFTYDKYFSFAPNKTSFYVGGIPSSYQTNKVSSRSFVGCISDVTFDGQELNLWRPTSQEGSTLCCQGAVEVITPEPDITPGASFTGFGFYRLPNDDFNVYESASISLDFQTSVPESVLMIVTRPDLISYIGIFMRAGNVMFEMNTAGNARYILQTLGTYNDARWYRVNVAYNSSHYRMDIGYANQTDAVLESFMQPTVAFLRFPNLRYAFKLFLGSPDPALSADIIRGPTNLRFAGCMKNVKLSNGTTQGMVSRPLTNTTAIEYMGVSFDGCRANVTAGIGFSGQLAFAQLSLPLQLARTRSISFFFKTLEPHGILAYSYGTLSFNKLFYIALYHGNIFVQYNAGEGLSEPLQTVGLRLNTGQWQEVTVQFTGLSASLKVNDLPTVYSMRHLQTEGIDILGQSSYLYVGGVPSTTPILIGGEFPIRMSLSGDLRDFMINSLSVNFNDGSIVLANHGLDLSGVTPPVSELPPRPYPTSPAPTGTAAPTTCREPTLVIPYPGAVRFGVTTSSYQAYQLTPQQAALFLNRFVIKLSFRALSPDGVMLYAANSPTTPRQFMGLVMIDGKLSFNILTDSRAMTGFNIATRERYDNALWQEVTILRIHDFVAILVEKTRDYSRNVVQLDSVVSSIAINTDLYVGGIGPGIARSGYHLRISNPFDGCIRMLEFQFAAPPDLIFNLSNPTSMVDVQPCSMNEVDPGGSFDGTGWLHLMNNFRIGDSLDIQLTIRTVMQNALLLAISGDAQNFIAMDIYNGLVRVIVSHGFMSSYIVRSTTLSSEFAVCNNQPHLLRFSFTTAALALTVDDNLRDVVSFDAGTPTVAATNGLAVYIGGIPDITTVPLISGIATNSFQGCMQDLLINNATVPFRDNLGKVGFTTGCPRPV